MWYEVLINLFLISLHNISIIHGSGPEMTFFVVESVELRFFPMPYLPIQISQGSVWQMPRLLRNVRPIQSRISSLFSATIHGEIMGVLTQFRNSPCDECYYAYRILMSYASKLIIANEPIFSNSMPHGESQLDCRESYLQWKTLIFPNEKADTRYRGGTRCVRRVYEYLGMKTTASLCWPFGNM